MEIRSPDLSIIIVTWNGKQYARECLDSLRNYLADPKVEIIVVDNASSDGTPALIQQEFPWVRLIENSANLGFAKANNIGMVACTGKYVCLVNSDVRVLSDCLPRMQAYMEANPSIGMLGPQMLGPNGLIGRSYLRFPTLWRGICDAFALRHIFRSSRTFNGIEMTDFNNSETSEVDVLNGWFLMVRRKALEQVGMLDEQFFMYGEDIDWSYRFHKSGWKRVYFSGARAFHHGGASSAVAPTRFYIEMRRANLQLCKKHYGSLWALGHIGVTCLHEIIRVVCFCLLGIARKSERSLAVAKTRRSLASIKWLIIEGHHAGITVS
jgi:GT2 family glycosyltransferase